MEDFTKMSDKKILNLCREYGKRTLYWRRKFIGLLPEVKKRTLFEKKNCKSIYEFAAKYAGVSREYVNRVVNLNERFAGTSILHDMLVNGEVSTNKLAKIASIVNLISEEDLIEAIQKLSCRTLETYVRDVKYRNGMKYGNDMKFSHKELLLNEENTNFKMQNGLFEPQNHIKSVHVNKSYGEGNMGICQTEVGCKETVNDAMEICDAEFAEAAPVKKLQLKLSEDTLEELLALQEKGIDVDTLFKEFLKKRGEDLTEAKAKVTAQVFEMEARKRSNGGMQVNRHGQNKVSQKKISRNIPIAVKKVLQQEFGDKCAVNGCGKKSEHIHHAVPFGLNQSHDPNLLAPLCRSHHDIAHSINAKYLGEKRRVVG